MWIYHKIFNEKFLLQDKTDKSDNFYRSSKHNIFIDLNFHFSENYNEYYHFIDILLKNKLTKKFDIKHILYILFFLHIIY